MKPDQPDAGTPAPTPVLDTDVERSARLGMWVLGLGFGGFLLWSVLAPLDQGFAGTGTVIVSGEKKTVQSLTPGRVDTLLAREGDIVKQGQVLLRLNSVQAEAQLETVVGQWINARCTEARLTAERSGQPSIAWPTDLLARANDPRVTSARTLHTQMFEARRKELEARHQILRHEQRSLASQIDGLNEIKRHQEARVTSWEKDLVKYRQLVGQGFFSINRVHEMEREMGEFSVDLATTLASIDRARQSINESKLKEIQLVQSFRSEVESQLASVSAEVATLTERIRGLEFEVANATIEAPASGQIVGLAIHTVGGVIQAGQRLMDVVPLKTPWQIKARFPVMSADRLRVGLPVAIRFSTLQRVETPVLTGKVETVSADKLVDEATGEPYYQAVITPDPALVAQLEHTGLPIKPGMEAEVMANTGERTLMNYLLKPIGDRLTGSLTEE